MHNLDVLLHFTGIETLVKTTYFAEWSALGIWKVEARYSPHGLINPADASLMIISAKTLLGIL